MGFYTCPFIPPTFPKHQLWQVWKTQGADICKALSLQWNGHNDMKQCTAKLKSGGRVGLCGDEHSDFSLHPTSRHTDQDNFFASCIYEDTMSQV